MKSALFVDFDNVYSQLRQLQPDAAERFARHPSEWMGWLTGSLALPEPHEEGERRRLLVRRCYLNPNWYQNYRHAFLRAGFEIVDCPPVTSQGKTSTDIHMVLDIVDLLQHETRCDEFIVFRRRGLHAGPAQASPLRPTHHGARHRLPIGRVSSLG